ncbi:MAG: methionine ABC transporter permease [Eubacteriales bacterium]|nr:ABC transporter permease [Eubacteriales bacterium]MDY4899131.1 methionine ABC transporter permease [Eubacteriales bacterium]
MSEFFEAAFGAGMLAEYGNGLLVTLYLTLACAAVAYIIGIPLGVILCVTDKDGIRPNRAVNAVIGFLVNVFRSIPFVILLVVALPFTKLVVGTKVGNTAFLVPLILSAAPFVARMVESSLKEVDRGVIEAAHSMGSTDMQIITKVLLPEARPSLIVGGAIAVTTILGYTPLATLVGGGGLGAIAVQYGLYRFKYEIMYVASIIIIILVEILQELGLRLAKKVDKRTR